MHNPSLITGRVVSASGWLSYLIRVPITYAGPDDVGIFTVSALLNFSDNTVAGMMSCRGRRGSLLAKLGVACWGRLGTVPRKFSPVAYRGRRGVVRGKLP